MLPSNCNLGLFPGTSQLARGGWRKGVVRRGSGGGSSKPTTTNNNQQQHAPTTTHTQTPNTKIGARRRVEQAGRLRWGSLFSCTVARAVATLLELLGPRGADGCPPSCEVERDFACWLESVVLRLVAPDFDLTRVYVLSKFKNGATPFFFGRGGGEKLWRGKNAKKFGRSGAGGGLAQGGLARLLPTLANPILVNPLCVMLWLVLVSVWLLLVWTLPRQLRGQHGRRRLVLVP